PHSHHESDSPHTHHHHADYDNVATAPHTHPHHAMSAKQTGHTQVAYRNVEASGRGHWHTFSVLSRVNLTYTAPLPVAFSCFPYPPSAQTSWFIPVQLTFHPRAPPALY